MKTTLGELVEAMISPIGKTLDDVERVTTDDNLLTVHFHDGTTALIQIDNPNQRTH